ncbi:MAG: YebC/PmpR family DNA-binding transcriptional regulator [Actinobacteria bacterium]|nr:YebC/PmpR family DNA-binding transcriptional regulator [Actinomycetota bacterium]
MSGHSKWSTIKHKKGKEDAKRGQIFSKLARAIIVAARTGGGNLEHNFTLETAIQKAKSYNMPNDTIERAIKKGTGELAGSAYEQIVYEGYGPAGVAVMVDVMTDNRNRTASDIRNIFGKSGGNLGTSGCVAWMFKKRGEILVNKDVEEEKLMSVVLEAGAEDINEEKDHWEILTAPSDLNKVVKALEENNILFSNAELTMLPENVVKLEKNEAKKVLRLMNMLEDHDDVQDVYANFDIPEDVLEELEQE